MKFHYQMIFIASCFIAGCGFHLMDSQQINTSYPQMVLSGDDNDIFYKELEKELLVRGVDVIPVKGDFSAYLGGDIPVLSCSPMIGGSSTLSVAGNAQPLEYTYATRISCNLFVKDHKPYGITNTLNRSFLNKAGATIASDAEQDAIKTESAIDQVKIVITRIQNSYLAIAQDKKKAPETTTEEPLKVVFNVTSADETTKEVTGEEAKKAIQEYNEKQKEDNLKTLPARNTDSENQ